MVLGCHRDNSSEAPDDDGCVGASCVEEAEAALWEGEDSAARVPLQKLCEEEEDAFSCFRLAELYQEGRGGLKDLAKAATNYELSCELDHHEGCERRYEMAEADGDSAVELEYSLKACEGGRSFGCMRAGKIFDEGRVGARDKVRAAEFYEQACGIGDADGCAAAGDLLFDPAGSTLTKARTFTAYNSACVGYSGRGCLQVALCFYEGIGVPPNIGKARSHFKSACELGVEDGCHNAKRLANATDTSADLELTTDAEIMAEKGLVVKELSCQSTEYGEAGLRSTLGALARHRRALNDCAKSGDGVAVGINWSFSKGKIKEVRSNGKASKREVGCVAKELRKKSAPGIGKCSAVLLLGDPDKADAAYPVKAPEPEPEPEKTPAAAGRSGSSGVIKIK